MFSGLIETKQLQEHYRRPANSACSVELAVLIQLAQPRARLDRRKRGISTPLVIATGLSHGRHVV